MSETADPYQSWPKSRGTTEQQLSAMHTLATSIEDLSAKNAALLRVLAAAKARLESYYHGTDRTGRTSTEEWQDLNAAVEAYEEQYGA